MRFRFPTMFVLPTFLPDWLYGAVAQGRTVLAPDTCMEPVAHPKSNVTYPRHSFRGSRCALETRAICSRCFNLETKKYWRRGSCVLFCTWEEMSMAHPWRRGVLVFTVVHTSGEPVRDAARVRVASALTEAQKYEPRDIGDIFSVGERSRQNPPSHVGVPCVRLKERRCCWGCAPRVCDTIEWSDRPALSEEDM